MNFLFEQSTLPHLDQLGCEALVLPLFSDEAPPRGALGYVDWRFAGKLSRLMEAGLMRGDLGAETLVPTRLRLPSLDKIFVVGLGESEGFDPVRFERAVDSMFEVAVAAKLRTFGLSLPGRSFGLVQPVEAIERFMRIAERALPPNTEITILDESPAIRAMEPVVAMMRRRIRARGIST